MGEVFYKRLILFLLIMCSLLLLFGILDNFKTGNKNYIDYNSGSVTGFVVHPVYRNFSSVEEGFNYNAISGQVSVSDDIVYKIGYYSVNGSSWRNFTLSGSLYGSSSVWLKGSALKTLPEFGEGEHYIIVYTCSYNNGWNCHDNRWQLLIINNTVNENNLNGDYYLSVDYLNNFSASGDSDYFIVTSNIAWSVSYSPSWVSLSKTSGQGDDRIYVSAGVNTGAQRSDIITLSGEGVPSASLGVMQFAGTSTACTGTKPLTSCTTSSGASGTRTVTCSSGNWITGICIAESSPPESNTGKIYYVSPSGSDRTGDGTINYPWFTLNHAWEYVSPGDTIYMRGGTYTYSSRQYLSGKSGSSGKMIKIWAYPYDSQKPTITRGSNYPTGCYDAVGIFFIGDYVHFKGLEIKGFAQPSGNGCVVSGLRSEDSSYNIFEQLDIHHGGHGMKLNGDSTGNLILNSDFHHNQDPYTEDDKYGNADGLEVGDSIPAGTTNTVSGCRFWWNTDDGIDLNDNEGNVIVNNSWAWYNGFIPDTFTKGGDGNGFKLGLSAIGASDWRNTVKKTVTNSLAFDNLAWGFNENEAKQNMEIYNCVAYHNGISGSWSGGFHLNVPNTPYYIKNNIAYKNVPDDIDLGVLTNVKSNSWNLGVTVSDSDFLSLDISLVDNSREQDGSLPDIDFLKLRSDSDLIDKGTNVGLPYSGNYPDLGAFEAR